MASRAPSGLAMPATLAKPATLATLVSATTLAQPASLATLVSGTTLAQPATLYARMDAAGIPEPILDIIARRVHTERFQEGLKEAIDTLATPFERALQKNQDFTTVLNQQVSCVFVDGTYDFLTIVLETNRETFIVYHYYRDRSYYERLVMELAIDDASHGRLLRFHCNIKGGERVFNDFAAYHASTDFNILPFHYLEEIAEMNESDLDEHMADHTDIQWRDPAAILAWFESHEDTFESLTDNHRVPVFTPLAGR